MATIPLLNVILALGLVISVEGFSTSSPFHTTHPISIMDDSHHYVVRRKLPNTPPHVWMRMKDERNPNDEWDDDKHHSHRDLLSARSARIVSPMLALSSAFTLLDVANAAKGGDGNTDTFLSTLQRYFPGSIPSTTVQLRVVSALRKRQYFPYNTLISTSLSSEETLDTPSSVISQLKSKLSNSKDGGVYHLGGLGGIPFAGSAGMEDLLIHAPNGPGGKVIVLFGPNVGISGDTADVGKVRRIGKDVPDESCGVIVRAYQSIVNKATTTAKPGSSRSINMEEDYIVNMLKSMPLDEYRNKGGDSFAIAKITQKLYKVISDLLVENVQTMLATKKYPNLEVTLIGGIIVNRDHGSGTEGGEDYFQPLMMEVIDGTDGHVTDLYKEVFGDLNAEVPKL